MDAFTIFAPSQHYSDFLDSFSSNVKLNVDFNESSISEAIYFHLCKIQYAGWRHRVNFKRYRKHSISEIFHDTIAFYLRAALSSEYTIELEPKVERTQPDIAIKKNGKYCFIIEVKTTIGWSRNSPQRELENRISLLSQNFNVDPKQVIYIFLDHANVGAEFSAKYWDKITRNAVEARPIDLPYSAIYPLFDGTDPYYWKLENGDNFDRKNKWVEITGEEIKRRAKQSIVTPFENILRLIENSTG